MFNAERYMVVVSVVHHRCFCRGDACIHGNDRCRFTSWEREEPNLHVYGDGRATRFHRYWSLLNVNYIVLTLDNCESRKFLDCGKLSIMKDTLQQLEIYNR